MKRRWLAPALLCVALAESRAAAQPSDTQREAARALANAGLELYQSGEYARAIERFRDAENIVHAPPHLLFIARSQRKLGRWLEARATLRAVADESVSGDAPAAFREAQSQAREELALLEERLPSLRIEVTGAPDSRPTAAVDGERVKLDDPVAVDPGEHRVVVEAEGYDSASRSVSAEEGAGVIEVRFDLSSPDGRGDGGGAPTAGEPSGTWRIPGIAFLAGGVVGLGVGATTGALALDKASELRAVCPSNPCPTANEGLADDANALATTSTVTLVAGGALVAAGVVWLVVAKPDGRGAGQQAVVVGPGNLSLRGSF